MAGLGGDTASPIKSQADLKSVIGSNFAKKLNPKKNQRENELKQSMNELRNEFMVNLAKVYDNATRKDGVLACHRIIQRNCDSPACLRIILGVLCDRSS